MKVIPKGLHEVLAVFTANFSQICSGDQRGKIICMSSKGYVWIVERVCFLDWGLDGTTEHTAWTSYLRWPENPDHIISICPNKMSKYDARDWVLQGFLGLISGLPGLTSCILACLGLKSDLPGLTSCILACLGLISDLRGLTNCILGQSSDYNLYTVAYNILLYFTHTPLNDSNIPVFIKIHK